jgi:hypothetical protein
MCAVLLPPDVNPIVVKYICHISGHEISGLKPVARSESLATIFFSTDLIQKKKLPNAYHQTKIYGRQWRPSDRKFRALSYIISYHMEAACVKCMKKISVHTY